MPHRLDRAPDDPRRGPPADGRLRRLPRGAGARRRRADRARGDGAAPVRDPHAHELAGYLPEIAAAYRRVGDAVQPHGTRLFVQLLHGGREQISGPPRAPALAPSAIPSQRFRVAPRALRAHEIEEIVAGFAAVRRARRGGRPRRRRDLRRAPLPGGAVLRPRAQPARRRMGRAVALPARRRARRARGRTGAGAGRAPVGRLAARRRRMAPLLAGEVDYLSLALGDSPSYLGSTLIVPPPPLGENLIEEQLEPVPRRAAADRDLARRRPGRGRPPGRRGRRRRRRHDARPDRRSRSARARHARAGCGDRPLHRLPGLHRPLPRRRGDPVRDHPAHRAGSGRGPRRPAAAQPRRLVVVGAGPAGLAAAAEAAAAGHEVDRARAHRAGRRSARARAVAPGGGSHRAPGSSPTTAHARGVDLRSAVEATVDTVAALAARRGRRRHRRPAVRAAVDARGRARRAGLGRAAASLPVVTGHVVVADWGGDPAGLDAAETLAAAGTRVTLCVASVAFGESVHQYRRNLALQRLYRAGVEIRQHLELAGASDGERRAPAQRLRAGARGRARSRRARARARSRAGRRARAAARRRPGCASRRRATASRHARSRRRSSRAPALHGGRSRRLCRS